MGGERARVSGAARAARRPRPGAPRRPRPAAHRSTRGRLTIGPARLASAAFLLACATAGAASVRGPADGEYRAALELVYDGSFQAAETRLVDLAREHPDDPVGPYLRALALDWRLEQDPSRHDLDASVLELADQALALADVRLGRDPSDARALLARGAAHGVKSRLHLFRWQRGPASREAVRMREALLAARAAGTEALDLDFGLGLYDYYADALPRFFKILAVFLRIPGGDRERGLSAISRVARGGSLFHDDEARVQMFEILSYFERRPDLALGWIGEMWQRHSGWPLWGLKLAEVERRLGLFAQSASVAGLIVERVARASEPNYQPVVGLMARVLLGEARLGDLRLAEAMAAALPACAGTKNAAWVAPRAELVVGRSLELEGDLAAAREHYRRAEGGADAEASRRAREALARPASAAERRAALLLAESRRLREAGRERAATARCLDAFRTFPASPEARLCAARESLATGRPDSARALARAVLDSEAPAWLHPDAHLVLAMALERGGAKDAAVAEYRRVFLEPGAIEERRREAEAALRRLQPQADLPQLPDYTYSVSNLVYK